MLHFVSRAATQSLTIRYRRDGSNANARPFVTTTPRAACTTAAPTTRAVAARTTSPLRQTINSLSHAPQTGRDIFAAEPVTLALITRPAHYLTVQTPTGNTAIRVCGNVVNSPPVATAMLIQPPTPTACNATTLRSLPSSPLVLSSPRLALIPVSHKISPSQLIMRRYSYNTQMRRYYPPRLRRCPPCWRRYRPPPCSKRRKIARNSG